MNMMKLYQFQLFLSLLLIIVNTTVLGYYIAQLSHSQIKNHLNTFGYFRRSPLDFDDVLDKETISAIKTYQQFFNLQVTGHLNTETLQQFSFPRCGIPADMRYEYGFDDGSNVSFPKGNKWFPKGTKKLTYGFLPENRIPIDIIKVFRNAFTQWSQTTRVLNFSQTTSYDDADIKIGFYNINYNDAVDDVVVSDSFISLKLDSNVKSGMIRLNGSKSWVLPTYNKFWDWQLQQFDLLTAVMHQIGHLLGLDHSSDKESIMYPTILPLQQRKVQITDSVNLAIQQLYSKGNANSHYSGLIASLSIGFAFVALLN